MLPAAVIVQRLEGNPMNAAAVWKAVVSVGAVGVMVLASGAWADECKAVHAQLTEHRVTEGCPNPARPCFPGEVDGNHGLRGTTFFQAEDARAALTGSPGWFSYNGFFEYVLARGTLRVRETGVTNAGFVTAQHQILEGTGEFAGATGYLFVSGRKLDGGATLVTEITGELCLP
jgi:hypothetical protein